MQWFKHKVLQWLGNSCGGSDVILRNPKFCTKYWHIFYDYRIEIICGILIQCIPLQWLVEKPILCTVCDKESLKVGAWSVMGHGCVLSSVDLAKFLSVLMILYSIRLRSLNFRFRKVQYTCSRLPIIAMWCSIQLHILYI